MFIAFFDTVQIPDPVPECRSCLGHASLKLESEQISLTVPGKEKDLLSGCSGEGSQRGVVNIEKRSAWKKYDFVSDHECFI